MTVLRLVLLSDTHTQLPAVEVPDGDVLIHAGDFCAMGTVEQAEAFAARFTAFPHPRKILIPGNHDRCLEEDPELADRLFPQCDYLLDDRLDLEGLPVWGSPWQPEFFDWAFNLPRGDALARVWANIPADTDILITHGPPMGILDQTFDERRVGCEALRPVVEQVRPRLHVFGHIHEGYGTHVEHGTLFVNASICTLSYQPTNAPIVVDLPLDRNLPARLVAGG